MKRRRATWALALSTAVLAAAGCGGSGSSDASSTAEWATGFCSALTTWTGSIQSLTETLDSSGLSRASLQRAADDATSVTETLAEDLRALGKPGTEWGEEAKDSLDRLSAGLQADLQEIDEAVGEVVGVSDLVRALPVIGRTLSTMGRRVQTTLQELEQLDTGGELEDALTKSATCDILTK
jgi:hypothetical protein